MGNAKALLQFPLGGRAPALCEAVEVLKLRSRQAVCGKRPVCAASDSIRDLFEEQANVFLIVLFHGSPSLSVIP